MNKDFFDTNKLYLKSVVDYKTRYHKKPNPCFLESSLSNGNENPVLPMLVGKKETT
jgi:hypothetical protein